MSSKTAIKSPKAPSKASFFQKRVLDTLSPAPRYLGEGRLLQAGGRCPAYLVYACPAQVEDARLFEQIPDFPGFDYDRRDQKEGQKGRHVESGLLMQVLDEEGVQIPEITVRWSVMAVDRDDPTHPLGAIVLESMYAFRKDAKAFAIWTHIHAAAVVPALRGKWIGTEMAQLAGEHFAEQVILFNEVISATSLQKFGTLNEAVFFADFASEGGERVCDAFVDAATLIEDHGVEITYDAGY